MGTHEQFADRLDGAPQRLRGNAFWLLGKAYRTAHHLTVEHLAHAGMRAGYYGVLATLAEFGPAAQAAIGRRLGVDPSDMVAFCNNLEEDGYVRRERDPADRRRNRVLITAAGLTALERFDAAIATAERATLAALPAADRAELIRLLQSVVDTPVPVTIRSRRPT